MSNAEILYQDLGGVDKHYQELLDSYAPYFESWWVNFLNAKNSNTKARGMVKEIDWRDNVVVGCFLNGLSKVSSDKTFFGAKDKFGKDILKPSRLLKVCKVLSGEDRDRMASIVRGNLIGAEHKNIRDKALVILQPKGNRETTRVDLV